jgi:hypothetical protein
MAIVASSSTLRLTPQMPHTEPTSMELRQTVVALVFVLLLSISFTGCGGAAAMSSGTSGNGADGGSNGGSPTPGGGNSSTWAPALKTSWQWQLSTLPAVGSLLNVQMYDVDGFNADAGLVSAMHSANIHAVCYVSFGTYEDWRSDASSFPASVKGVGVVGWPGEQWLDVRQISALSPVMRARLQMCKDKGFDAVEPDNVDGYTNVTGFSLTAADQLAYNRWLASTAHSMGMSVALKNDLDQVTDLVSNFDFALDEQCFEFSECDKLAPFISANKAVFEVEYSLATSAFCSQANAMNFNSLKKDLDLTATVTACR